MALLSHRATQDKERQWAGKKWKGGGFVVTTEFGNANAPGRRWREADVGTVPHVGVGEVFVISGQSNFTNYGEVQQKIETGLVSNFRDRVVLANDPQPGLQDNSKKGSFIPSFGDALYGEITSQWLPCGGRQFM